MTSQWEKHQAQVKIMLGMLCDHQAILPGSEEGLLIAKVLLRPQ